MDTCNVVNILLRCYSIKKSRCTSVLFKELEYLELSIPQAVFHKYYFLLQRFVEV